MSDNGSVRGGLGLVFDAVDGVTNIVEGMHRNIVWPPFLAIPRGRAPGIAGFVYACVRGVNSVLRGGVGYALAPSVASSTAGEALGDTSNEVSHEPFVSILNGVIGDHLEDTDNALAISMSFRVRGRALRLERDALMATLPDAREHVLVLVHGLCMNDLHWTRTRTDGKAHSHGDALASALGCTPLYLRYNSGRHVSHNGDDLAGQLTQLDEQWPVPLKKITLVGHSLGGLVIRSALHAAALNSAAWLPKVARVVYLGTPHHGAVLERAGNRFQALAAWSRYTAPLARLGAIRSAAVTDLRYGNVVDADWNGAERFERHDDCRCATPLTEGPQHFAIAGTLSPAREGLAGTLLGDGLVHPSSAIGRHDDPARTLGFRPENIRIFPATGHMELLADPDVYAQLEAWLYA